MGDLWINADTGDEAKRRPFVRKRRGKDMYDCTIYETRPEVCREYPQSVSQMRIVDCEMMEDGDTDADVAKFMAAENGTACDGNYRK